MFKASEIREKFLQYFEENGHTIVPSSPLIPKDDPSLLFTNAGMVQFKKVFLGQEKRDYIRATSAQKCLRVGGKHNDLENVGRTARHHTFFEMLGNFSFGDYFKEEAIRLAWEFLTKELELPKEKLYATVYKDDDEAILLWKKIAGLPDEKIFRLGEKDNFWSMGDTGPCGPCSEILFDQGEHMACGPDCGIGECDCDRYLEIWNLVFMQYDRDESGKLNPLPRPSIDTGMGLERITAVCQGVYSNFDTDLFTGLIQFTEAKAGVKYRENEDTDTALRVIADHSRAMAFMLADGILPSNEGRGYVLRRLIRRAFRFGRLLGLKDPFLFAVADEVINEMGEAYPELKASREFMLKVIRQEEERFSETLDKGLKILEEELLSLQKQGVQTIPGEVAFKLYDTYGFPIDIVNDIAEKQGFDVDENGFNKCMAAQKERAKSAWKGSGEKDLAGQFKRLIAEGLQTEFVGYDRLTATARVVYLLDEQALGVLAHSLSKGQTGFVVTSRTPFYGESGGQVGDKGQIKTASGICVVEDTIKPAAELIVHKIRVTQGEILLDQEAELQVDEKKRMATARNHTATHLLHAALRKILGEHVKQAGSLVEDKRLRFDFTHIQALSPDEIKAVEKEVNTAILANLPVKTEIMPYNQAVAKGAMALFGEKYADQVRVVTVPGVSIELCGGTHLQSTGQIGYFNIVSESAVAAGVRRIEAITGFEAIHCLQNLKQEMEELQSLLKAGSGQLKNKVMALQEQIKILNKEKQALADKLASGRGKDLLQEAQEINGIMVLSQKVEAPDVGALRKLMDDLRSKLKSGIILLGCEQKGKAMLILYVSKDLHDKFTAPALVKEVAKEIGGSGGGRPELAQAGGPNIQGLDKALEKIKELIS
ncbi:alanine--tRNA ligase [Desulfohalobiaceae bacterium Ax17]|uniref:alanine--tRNA ligase n=1 Tax=Desulfovulcanus ferrireducens TaxID=2831190 RepID=UPI00207BAB7B|nr:alanine--tRNA ligase [Desulfovulcanus ferrireducens]